MRNPSSQVTGPVPLLFHDVQQITLNSISRLTSSLASIKNTTQCQRNSYLSPRTNSQKTHSSHLSLTARLAKRVNRKLKLYRNPHVNSSNADSMSLLAREPTWPMHKKTPATEPVAGLVAKNTTTISSLLQGQIGSSAREGATALF